MRSGYVCRSGVRTYRTISEVSLPYEMRLVRWRRSRELLAEGCELQRKIVRLRRRLDAADMHRVASA